jgi:hypothetical protein
MQGKNQYQERYINSRVYETLRKEYAEYISKMNTGRVQPADEKSSNYMHSHRVWSARISYENC